MLFFSRLRYFWIICLNYEGLYHAVGVFFPKNLTLNNLKRERVSLQFQSIDVELCIIYLNPEFNPT